MGRLCGLNEHLADVLRRNRLLLTASISKEKIFDSDIPSPVLDIRGECVGNWNYAREHLLALTLEKS